MRYSVEPIIQQVEGRFINDSLHPTLTVIMSCSPTQDEISYLKQIYKSADKYGVTLRELRTCEPMQIAEDMRGYPSDGAIRISDFGADNRYVDNRIGCERDLDGSCAATKVQWLYNNSELRAFPCTALACYLALLEYFDGKTHSKDVSIINRSNVVGKPLALLLSSNRGNECNATVDIIHTQTARPGSRVFTRDAIVTATGKPNSFGYDVISNSMKPPLIVDVGLGLDDNGKLHGDVTDDIINGNEMYVAKVGKLTTTVLFAKLFGGFRCVTWR